MTYTYKNKETGEVIEKELSMRDDIPSNIVKDGKTYYREWASTIKIPYQWGHESNLNFNKSPSGNKHYY